MEHRRNLLREQRKRERLVEDDDVLLVALPVSNSVGSVVLKRELVGVSLADLRSPFSHIAPLPANSEI